MPEIAIDPVRCKGCGLCVAACPQRVLALGTRSNASGYFYPVTAAPRRCLGCRLCAIACPDTAVAVARVGTAYHYFPVSI